jgi:hypothetical protein
MALHRNLRDGTHCIVAGRFPLTRSNRGFPNIPKGDGILFALYVRFTSKGPLIGRGSVTNADENGERIIGIKEYSRSRRSGPVACSSSIGHSRTHYPLLEIPC